MLVFLQAAQAPYARHNKGRLKIWEDKQGQKMRQLAVIVFLSTNYLNVFGQSTCPCIATTKKKNQHRSEAKHATNYDDFVLKEDTITTAYINKWERKYRTKTSSISRTPTNPASKRKHDTPEDSLYILKGFMWFVKLEGNDCDFHIEIGPRNVIGNRIIIEVTRENIELQKKIKDKLDELGLKIMHCGTSSSNTAHYDVPIPVVVTGLGFYDVSHAPNTNHGDIHSKKYSWELHPVRDIEFLDL